MERLTRRCVLGGGLGLTSLAALVRTPAAAQEPRFFRIATGPSDSSYFGAGTLLGQVVSSPPGARECERGGSCGVPGLVAITQTTAGPYANIEQVGGGRLESGLAQADIAYRAFHGVGPWRERGAVRSLRAIANLYREALQIVVRAESGIETVQHLSGRTVAIGEPLSATQIAARAVIEAAGIGDTGMQVQGLSPVQAAEALRDGTIHAYFELSGVPSQAIGDLAQQTAIRLVPVQGLVAERLKATGPFFRDASVAANAYKDVAATPTVSLGVVWIVNADVPQEVVHGLTRALFHDNNRAALDRDPIGRQIRLESALDGIGFDFHPGAALFYFEAGIDRGLVERSGQDQPPR